MQLKELFNVTGSKYRLWAVMGALGFGILGALSTLSITASLFNPAGLFSKPGFFLLSSYGFLAFIVPAYLLYAALLLADPRYRPEQIFILCSLIIPFVTLALGFYWLREFETLRVHSPFISRTGKLGIGLFIFFLVAFETLLIALFRFLLFTRRNRPKKTANEPGKNAAGELTDALSPPKSKALSLRDIYAEAAAAMSIDDMDNSPVPAVFGEPEESSEVTLVEEVPADEASVDKTAYVTAETDEDVEKALAEASAFAAEEAARHGDKGAADAGGKEPSQRKKRRIPYFVPVEGLLKQ